MPNGDPNYQIGVLETRVGSIEAAFKGFEVRFSEQMDGIARKIDARSQTQWGTIISFGGLLLATVGGLWAFAFKPIEASFTRIETSQATQAATTSAALQKIREDQTAYQDRNREIFATAKDVDYRLTVSGARRDDQYKGVLDRLERIEGAADKTSEKIVPRGEHAEKWKGNDQRFEDHQRQLDELKRFNVDLVSAKDFLKGVDERLRTIEARAYRAPPP